MATELTGSEIIPYPNGHDSTGLFEKPKEPSPAIRIIRADRADRPQTHISTGQDADRLETPISTAELYPTLESISPELNAANRLVSLCLEHVEQALTAQREGEAVMADDAMQNVQSLLPELFCCRSLGDGFGIIVNGLLCAFQNLQGVPLRRDQIETVRRALQKLRSEPFASVESAVDRLGDLEAAGLQVEPAEFHVLAEMLDE